MSNYDLPPGHSVQMDNVDLTFKQDCKHLGVQLSSYLKFDNHFNTISKKFQQRVNLLCYMGRYLPYPNIALLYKSYVRPTIEYATPIWSLTPTTAQLAMFDVLQAKVCRRLLRSAKIEFDRYESKDSLNSMCNLESLHFRRTLIATTIPFKYIHFQPHILSLFDINISRSERRPNKACFQLSWEIFIFPFLT